MLLGISRFSVIIPSILSNFCHNPSFSGDVRNLGHYSINVLRFLAFKHNKQTRERDQTHERLTSRRGITEAA